MIVLMEIICLDFTFFFFTNILFSVLVSDLGTHVAFDRHSLLYALFCDTFSLFLVSYDLDTCEEYWSVTLYMSLKLSLSDVFL